jgi:ribosomal protein S6
LGKYEAVFILDPRKVEGDGNAFSETIKEQIQALGGTVTREKFLEKRQFARPIGKHKAGLYWDYIVEMGPQAVAQLENKYSLNATVLRLAVFKYEDGQDDYLFDANRDTKFFKEDAFQDEFDRDDRPYRSSRDK